MFSFIVKYLGFLKAVPLLALFFESELKLWMLITNPRLADYTDSIETEVLSWRGTVTSLHKYGGIQFNYQGREIGHIHGNGILDIPFSLTTKKQVMAEGRISPHHVFTKSGWVSFYIRESEDSEYAKKLLKIAYLKLCRKVNVSP